FGPGGLRFRKQQEARVVLMVVFEVGGKDAAAVDRGGNVAGDGGGAGDAPLGQHLHAACRVVVGNLLDLWMAREEAAALGERHWVRVHLPEVLQRRPRKGDKVVYDAEVHFARDVQVAREQEVVILVDGAGQRVFDGREAVLRLAAGRAPEDRGKGLARLNADLAAQQLVRGLFAERASFSLDRKSTRLNSSHVSSSYAVFC